MQNVSNVESGAVQRCEDLVDLVKSFPYSNENLLANIGVDTAENEPLEVWGGNSIQYSFAS